MKKEESHLDESYPEPELEVEEVIKTVDPVGEEKETLIIKTPEETEKVKTVDMGDGKTAVTIAKKIVRTREPKSFMEINYNHIFVELSLMETYETLKKRMRTMDHHIEATLEEGTKQSFNKTSVHKFGPLKEEEESQDENEESTEE